MDKQAVFRNAMNIIHYAGLGRLAAPSLKGIGAFMMLHHILPGGGRQSGFAPNNGLEITPHFLANVIQLVRKRGYNIVSIEESFQILSGAKTSDRPFVVFTIDDGYRDNFQHALPVFEKHDCPFTIFIAPQITDGKSELWWRGLEQAINDNDKIKVELDGKTSEIASQSVEQKKSAFDEVYWPVRNLPEHEQRVWIRKFCEQHGVDLDEMCAKTAMNWGEVRQIAANRLCTIGAHTIDHFAVAKLTKDEALSQAINSRDRIAKELGKVPRFFAYPYGDETSAGPRDFELMHQAGFKMALTTRKGLIYDEHKAHLTALPRLSLNGAFQETHYIDALLSGLPFALFNRFKKLNVS